MHEMTTVAIVGAGEVAGATAQALASRDAVRRVVIVDADQGAAAGKALDIRQSGPIEGFHASLEGTNDESRLTGCDLCIIADRFGTAGEWRGEEALSMLTRIVPQLGDAPLVFAGASQADLITTAATETSVRR